MLGDDEIWTNCRVFFFSAASTGVKVIYVIFISVQNFSFFILYIFVFCFSRPIPWRFCAVIDAAYAGNIILSEPDLCCWWSCSRLQLSKWNCQKLHFCVLLWKAMANNWAIYWPAEPTKRWQKKCVDWLIVLAAVVDVLAVRRRLEAKYLLAFCTRPTLVCSCCISLSTQHDQIMPPEHKSMGLPPASTHDMLRPHSKRTPLNLHVWGITENDKENCGN